MTMPSADSGRPMLLLSSRKKPVASTMPGMARISMPLSSIACPASGRWRARSSRLLHSSIIVRVTLNSPAAMAMRREVVNACQRAGCASTSSILRLTPSTMTASSGGSSSSRAAPISNPSLSRLCRRSSGSRQPRTWLTPIATALLRRWLSSTSPRQQSI